MTEITVKLTNEQVKGLEWVSRHEGVAENRLIGDLIMSACESEVRNGEKPWVAREKPCRRSVKGVDRKK